MFDLLMRANDGEGVPVPLPGRALVFAGADGLLLAKLPTGEVIPFTGATGETGAQGLPGEAGAVGAPGAQGTQGLQGVPGVAGAIGATGAQGVAGQGGEAGSDYAVGNVFLVGAVGVNCLALDTAGAGLLSFSMVAGGRVTTKAVASTIRATLHKNGVAVRTISVSLGSAAVVGRGWCVEVVGVDAGAGVVVSMVLRADGIAVPLASVVVDASVVSGAGVVWGLGMTMTGTGGDGVCVAGFAKMLKGIA